MAYSQQYPVVTITGPRQSGKTTLTKMIFPDKPYVSLESIEERDFAQNDAKGFLSQFPQGAILDEIQRVPDLLSYLQVLVDEAGRPGQFILTGSQNFELLDSVSQSLAGRTALVKLLPFSLEEIRTISGPPETIDSLLYKGAYPRIYDLDLDPTEALSFYFSTYVERDLRQLINVKDLGRFETFIKLCATRVGQVLNLSSLGNDCGVSHNTIKSWLSILQTSYIIKLLQPYYNNLGKRLIKSPKLYFYDTGLAAFLLGIQQENHVVSHPLRGALFENMVVSELLKKRFNQGKTDNLYYLRDSRGNEVDILLDYGLHLDMIEIKSGQTLTKSFFGGLHYYRRLYQQTRNCFLVYGGDIDRMQEDVKIIPWDRLSFLTIE
ncbi:ATP-binding protein [Desulfobacter vibrioformis]|uniref:ATP-binding protein n=1 Tax=Desulfobacter vibrioformis TaxID=34031 RepID=UPI001FE080FB|nr:ATP-binding protein [Desulfobacter vibrioformis]